MGGCPTQCHVAGIGQSEIQQWQPPLLPWLLPEYQEVKGMNEKLSLTMWQALESTHLCESSILLGAVLLEGSFCNSCGEASVINA